MDINIKCKIAKCLLLTVMLVYVLPVQNLFASQEYRSFFHSNNGDGNMAITANEYTLDQHNKGYRNFNEDTSAGLYYLHARYYDPNTKQFLTKDPAGMKNMYAYCARDSLNAVDEQGLFSKGILSHTWDGIKEWLGIVKKVEIQEATKQYTDNPLTVVDKEELIEEGKKKSIDIDYSSKSRFFYLEKPIILYRGVRTTVPSSYLNTGIDSLKNTKYHEFMPGYDPDGCLPGSCGNKALIAVTDDTEEAIEYSKNGYVFEFETNFCYLQNDLFTELAVSSIQANKITGYYSIGTSAKLLKQKGKFLFTKNKNFEMIIRDDSLLNMPKNNIAKNMQKHAYIEGTKGHADSIFI